MKTEKIRNSVDNRDEARSAIQLHKIKWTQHQRARQIAPWMPTGWGSVMSVSSGTVDTLVLSLSDECSCSEADETQSILIRRPLAPMPFTPTRRHRRRYSRLVAKLFSIFANPRQLWVNRGACQLAIHCG